VGELIDKVMRGARINGLRRAGLPTVQRIPSSRDVPGRADDRQLLRRLAQHLNCLNGTVEHLAYRPAPSAREPGRPETSFTKLPHRPTYKPSVNFIFALMMYECRPHAVLSSMKVHDQDPCLEAACSEDIR